MVIPGWEPPLDDDDGFYQGRFGRRRARASSLDAFYSSPERRGSEELDLGDRWTSEGQRNATFAVRWIEATGEIYALRLTEPFAGKMRIGLWYLSGLFVPHLRNDPDPSIEVIARCHDRERLAELVNGWEEQMPKPNSLEWLRQRLD
jgi:hypothetical protein